MADDVFHVTFTRNLPDIQERGLDPLSESLWSKQETGERYQQEPSIYSFSDPGDALRWASKMRYEFGYEDESSSPADVSIVRLRGGEHWDQDPSEDLSLGKSSRRSLQPIAPEDVLEVISVPEPAGINEEFQREVPGGAFDEWIQYYGSRIREPRPTEQATVPETSSEHLIKLRQAAENIELPEEVAAAEPPPTTPFAQRPKPQTNLPAVVQKQSGITKLPAFLSNKAWFIRALAEGADQFKKNYPEEAAEIQEFMNRPVHDVVGLEEPLGETVLGFIERQLGAGEPEQEPTGIATLEPGQEALRAYDKVTATSQSPLIDTPEFKSWFKRSNVINDKGHPLVVYHGTSVGDPETGEIRESFLASDKSWGRRSHPSDLGEWFTEDPPVADHFAGERTLRDEEVGPHVIPVYLSLQNPKIFESYDDLEDAINTFESKRIAPSDHLSGTDFVDHLKEQGYDGIEIEDSFTDVLVSRRDFVIFDGNQAKSTFNVGTFDPLSSNIGKAAGGFVDKPLYDRAL